MRKIFKVIWFLLVVTLVIGLVGFGYVTSYVVSCFEGANITLQNVINNDFTQEQYDIIIENAKVKGKQAANSLVNSFKPDLDFSDMPEVEYLFPELDEFFNEEWENNNQKSLKKGLDALNNLENEFSKSRQKGLDLLEASEMQNQKIREETLKSDDPANSE